MIDGNMMFCHLCRKKGYDGDFDWYPKYNAYCCSSHIDEENPYEFFDYNTLEQHPVDIGYQTGVRPFQSRLRVWGNEGEATWGYDGDRKWETKVPGSDL